MVAELRKMGDKIALYTDDARTYRRFSKWAYTLYKIPYIQDRKLVGADFYFNKGFKSTIKCVIKGQLTLDI